eukprot:5075011-Lingulodinium_polyedra.AAC.1
MCQDQNEREAAAATMLKVFFCDEVCRYFKNPGYSSASSFFTKLLESFKAVEGAPAAWMPES